MLMLLGVFVAGVVLGVGGAVLAGMMLLRRFDEPEGVEGVESYRVPKSPPA